MNKGWKSGRRHLMAREEVAKSKDPTLTRSGTTRKSASSSWKQCITIRNSVIRISLIVTFSEVIIRNIKHLCPSRRETRERRCRTRSYPTTKIRSLKTLINNLETAKIKVVIISKNVKGSMSFHPWKHLKSSSRATASHSERTTTPSAWLLDAAQRKG